MVRYGIQSAVHYFNEETIRALRRRCKVLTLWPRAFFLSGELEFMVQLASIRQLETQGLTSGWEVRLVLSKGVVQRRVSYVCSVTGRGRSCGLLRLDTMRHKEKTHWFYLRFKGRTLSSVCFASSSLHGH